MYLNFSNFRGRTSAGGGQALVQKRGQVSDGGIGKIFTGWGTPSPPRKNPAMCVFSCSSCLNIFFFSFSLQTSSTPSWTDDLPTCNVSGIGYSTNQVYRPDGAREEEHAFEDRCFHFQ